jgi:predicted transcriptional regulator
MSNLRISNAAARRIARLAKSGGRTPQRVLDAALRAGLDYLEWFEREVAKGQADMLRIKGALGRALKKAV